MDDPVETGYQMEVREESQTPLIRYICDECGEYDVEARWWCKWDRAKQTWVPHEDCDEYHCNDCGDQVNVTVEEI